MQDIMLGIFRPDVLNEKYKEEAPADDEERVIVSADEFRREMERIQREAAQKAASVGDNEGWV